MGGSHSSGHRKMLAQVQECSKAIKSWYYTIKLWYYTIHGCVSGTTTPGPFEYWHQIQSISATAVPIATGICMPIRSE